MFKNIVPVYRDYIVRLWRVETSRSVRFEVLEAQCCSDMVTLFHQIKGCHMPEDIGPQFYI